MARKARYRNLVVAMVEPEEDARPYGCVNFADPSTTRMAERVNTFNEPHNKDSVGEVKGFRPLFGSQNPWEIKRSGDVAWEQMERKRGVCDDSDNDGDCD